MPSHTSFRFAVPTATNQLIAIHERAQHTCTYHETNNNFARASLLWHLNIDGGSVILTGRAWLYAFKGMLDVLMSKRYQTGYNSNFWLMSEPVTSKLLQVRFYTLKDQLRGFAPTTCVWRHFVWIYRYFAYLTLFRIHLQIFLFAGWVWLLSNHTNTLGYVLWFYHVVKIGTTTWWQQFYFAEQTGTFGDSEAPFWRFVALYKRSK